MRYTNFGMKKNIERQGLKDLQDIKEELAEIRDFGTYPRSFLSGMLHGAGAIMGGIIAIAALGWFLSVLGLIPGFGDIAHYLSGLVEKFNAGRRL
ncbi:MAG: hypothetical protein RIQ56_691 [Candidatus Parcubacteria bacterium]|jgi:hypothetical protein